LNAAYDKFRRVLERECGIALDDDKSYLVESRLAPLMEARQIKDLASLMQRFDQEVGLVDAVVQAMTTNETLFFRDRTPFDNFRDILLPRMMAARQQTRRIRIWCAAASTGQEPYSLAMILDEQARALTGWQVEIVATDISQRVITAAREGLYNQFEVQRGLPITMLLRYFNREGELWRINEHLRSRITFKTQNLMSDFRGLGLFDIIFCRNVLIYFDVRNKVRVLSRLALALQPDGVLCLGAAETVAGLSDDFQADSKHRSLNTRTISKQSASA
jgi:chemotaxis protein methyltransferase CheR